MVNQRGIDIVKQYIMIIPKGFGINKAFLLSSLA